MVLANIIANLWMQENTVQIGETEHSNVGTMNDTSWAVFRRSKASLIRWSKNFHVSRKSITTHHAGTDGIH